MSDNLFEKYFEERSGVETLKNEKGFIQYVINEDTLNITDMFILPEFRRKGEATELANKVKQIAKANRCKYMTSEVDVRAGGKTTSALAILNYGFEILDITNNTTINFYMEL